MSVNVVGGSSGGTSPEGSKRKREEKSTGSRKSQRGLDGTKIEKRIEETVEMALQSAEKSTRNLEDVSSKEPKYTVLNATFIPPDVMEEIFGYLDKKSVESLSLTGKNMHSLVSSSMVVQKRFLDEFIDEQFTKAKKPDSRTITVINIAKIQAKMGALEKAKETLSEAKIQAQFRFDFYKFYDLIEIAKAEAEIGATEEAHKTLSTAEKFSLTIIHDVRSQINALIEVAEVKIVLGDFKKAEETLATVEKLAPHIRNNTIESNKLKDVVKALAQISIITKNKEVLAHAKDLALRIIDPDFKYKALVDVAKAESELGATEEAKKTLTLAKETALLLIDVPLVEIAKVQSKIGAIKEAMETLLQAKEQALSIQNAQGNPEALIPVLTAQIEIGLLTKNKEVLLRAKEIALLIDKPIREYEAFIKIAKAESEIGATEEARKSLVELEKNLIPKLLNTWMLPELLPKIVEVQVTVNGLEAGRKTLAKVKEDTFLSENIANRYQNLTKIAEIQIKIGDLEEVKKTLLQVKETAFLVESTYATFRALIQVAITESEIDAIEEAIETLAKAKELEQNLTNLNFVETGVAIAKAQIKRGNLEKASETLSKAKENVSHISPSTQFPALIKLVEAENTLQAIEAKNQARRGNIIAVRKYLEESSLKKENLLKSENNTCSQRKTHLDMAKEALELGSIAFQAMRS